MRLTLFINPQHRADDSIARCFEEHQEQVRVARAAGYGGIAVAHRLSYGGSVWLPPLETLARLCPDAEGMDVGTCMLLLPLLEPVHVAEQSAYLDVLSGGRLILGVAPGWHERELELLGIDPRQRLGRFREGVELLKRLWTEDGVDFDGRHFGLRGATLALRPVQKPRPRLWLGGSVSAAVERAARLADTAIGDSWVASSHLSHDEVRRQAVVFRDALGALGKGMPADFPVLRNVVVAADRDTALHDAAAVLSATYNLESREQLAERAVVGSPEECAETLAAVLQDTGCNHLIARVQWLGMDRRVVLRTIELLGERVRPLLAA